MNKRMENGTAVPFVRRYHGRREVKVVTGGGRASLVLVGELYGTSTIYTKTEPDT